MISNFLPFIQGHKTLYGLCDSFNGFFLTSLAEFSKSRTIIHICRDDSHVNLLAQECEILNPSLTILTLPSWDCLPYDRLSPQKLISGNRIKTLTRLLEYQNKSCLLILSVSSFFQRLPPRSFYEQTSLTLTIGEKLDPKALETYFISHGFNHASTVREPGEFSIRGGIIDFYAACEDFPYRLDLFGQEIEELKSFDPVTQCSLETFKSLSLSPTSEILLNPQTIAHFRQHYRYQFGIAGEKDPLYQAISAGRLYPGAEHWLPLFYPSLDTILDYITDPIVCFDQRALESGKSRLQQVEEYYQTRHQFKFVEKGSTGAPYHPLPVSFLYPSMAEIEKQLEDKTVFHFSPFNPVHPHDDDLKTRSIPDFSASRHQQNNNLFDHVKDRIVQAQTQGKRVILTATTRSPLNKFAKVLQERDLNSCFINNIEEINSKDFNMIGLFEFPMENGLETPTKIFITEQDILGERQKQSVKRKKRSDLFINTASNLNENDYVVHQDHGVGQFKGLETLSVGNIPHDCVVIHYEGDDKLFVPVENLDVLSRYGGESTGASLDRLGSSSWQNRKAKIKKRLLEIAAYLINLAAERQVHQAEIFTPHKEFYQEFAARFPYSETEDQNQAIDEILEDLSSGKPMDRLICGDVGFGKTEVAMRAAFVVASSGKQVALIVPTTLLCRQHFRNFQDRFQGLGLHIKALSRLVTPKESKQVKEDIFKGDVDIVVGTHSLLSTSVTFQNLGLVIVDEEQHFGVKQKERLKELKKDVHLLTLSATPLPRTLQMALSGVRDLSLIATPPLDRLPVRTFVLPYDPVVIREAILRERYRGGQIFYVCPRIEDFTPLIERLKILVPEIRIVVAHGQLTPSVLEQVMNDFYDQKYDLLLSTNIIESGLDITSVNTIIIHRSDLFGLAQLYQLRGRVGRAKVRGYAYLTLPEHHSISDTAYKRLEVMQSLDTLGAGFQLASHDMDIRGAGNLLGEEQSGHIREVGIELYQQMLEDALTEVKTDLGKIEKTESFFPQLNLGLAVLIPEKYISDLTVRLQLYRRLSNFSTLDEIENFKEELVDRFGPFPEEVENLLHILALKQLCRTLGIEKIDAGHKGCIVSFFKNECHFSEALLLYIISKQGAVRLRPDQKLVFLKAWQTPLQKLKGVEQIVFELTALNSPLKKI